jgi:hypothetical protein
MSSPTLNDGEMSSSPSDTEAEADAHEELLAFISKLDPEKKRKAEDDDVQIPQTVVASDSVRRSVVQCLKALPPTRYFIIVGNYNINLCMCRNWL